MTGVQKCSHVHGIACDVGLGAYVWIHGIACDVGLGAYVWMWSVDRAALEYNVGNCNAIHGDLRGGDVCCSLVGSSVGGGSSVCTIVVVGVAMGIPVCGMLFRVCCRCTRGAVHVMCGAVGFDEVGACGCSPFDVACSPFDAGHGSVAGSYVGVLVGGVPVNFLMAAIVVRNTLLRVVCGSISMHLISSFATCAVCSAGVRVGS